MTGQRPIPERNGWAEAAFAFGVCGFLAGVGLTLAGSDGTAGLIAGAFLIITACAGRRDAAKEP